MPFRSLTFLTALLHVYLALRLLPAIASVTPAWPVLAVLLAISAVAMPLPFIGLWAGAHRLGNLWQWLGLLAMGWFSSMFVLTVLRDAVLLVAGLVAISGGPEIVSGAWRDASALWVAGLASLVTAIGFWNARRTAAVRTVDVPIRSLPDALSGFRIVQLSDLHVGPTIRRAYIERIVAVVNGLNADLVAITGDLVDGSVLELREHIAPLADLRSRHGSFVVTGNHEYYAGAGAWVAELRRLGLTVLMNEHVLLRTAAGSAASALTGGMADADALVLAGVTDFHAAHFDAAQASDPAGALKGAPEAARTRILLAHQPRSAPAAAEAGYRLQLSGHTHGGQFYPWNLFVPMQQPFVAGLHRLQDMWVYVSRGTGYWGPPKRFGAPSEITVLRLVPAAA